MTTPCWEFSWRRVTVCGGKYWPLREQLIPLVNSLSSYSTLHVIWTHLNCQTSPSPSSYWWWWWWFCWGDDENTLGPTSSSFDCQHPHHHHRHRHIGDDDEGVIGDDVIVRVMMRTHWAWLIWPEIRSICIAAAPWKHNSYSTINVIKIRIMFHNDCWGFSGLLWLQRWWPSLAEYTMAVMGLGWLVIWRTTWPVLIAKVWLSWKWRWPTLFMMALAPNFGDTCDDMVVIKTCFGAEVAYAMT